MSDSFTDSVRRDAVEVQVQLQHVDARLAEQARDSTDVAQMLAFIDASERALAR